MPGADTFLQEISRSPWAVAFATRGTRAVSLRKLASLNANFDENALVTSTEHSRRRDIVEAAIQYGLTRHAISRTAPIISIGDGPWDLNLARQLGIDFIGIKHLKHESLLQDSGVQ